MSAGKGTDPRRRFAGAREKAVLLSVEGKRLLVGVAPGRVQTLLVLGGSQTAEDAFAGTCRPPPTACSPQCRETRHEALVADTGLLIAQGQLLRRASRP